MKTEIYLRNNMYTIEIEAQSRDEDELIRLFFNSEGEIVEQFQTNTGYIHNSITLTKER